MTRPLPQFPDGFCWGVATSAYQTEGSPAADGRGRPVWDTFCQRPGTIRAGRTTALATDSYRALADRYGPKLPPVYLTDNGCSADDRLSRNGAVEDQFRIDYLDARPRAWYRDMIAGQRKAAS